MRQDPGLEDPLWSEEANPSTVEQEALSQYRSRQDVTVTLDLSIKPVERTGSHLGVVEPIERCTGGSLVGHVSLIDSAEVFVWLRATPQYPHHPAVTPSGCFLRTNCAISLSRSAGVTGPLQQWGWRSPYMKKPG